MTSENKSSHSICISLEPSKKHLLIHFVWPQKPTPINEYREETLMFGHLLHVVKIICDKYLASHLFVGMYLHAVCDALLQFLEREAAHTVRQDFFLVDFFLLAEHCVAIDVEQTHCHLDFFADKRIEENMDICKTWCEMLHASGRGSIILGGFDEA